MKGPMSLSISHAFDIKDQRKMISTRPGVDIQEDDGVRCVLGDSVLTDSDRKEFVFSDKWEAEHAQHTEGRLLFEDVIRKSNFIQTFQRVVPRLKLSGGEKVLEMGASHCWATVLLKAMYPDGYFVAADLLPNCVKHATKWERLLGAKIDEKWAFNSREIPFEDAQFDIIFTFAAFHHFGENGNYEAATREMIRILKPGGRIFLLYEPSSPQLFYRSAFRRVNRKRQSEGVDEDVLLCGKLRRVVERLGCSFEVATYPIWQYRESVGSTIYYFLLSMIGPLNKLFVSTVNIEIHKPAVAQILPRKTIR
jgi:ubiquinone/menaquinone biosynthesis C-methylase UbiE